jgi:hypothetical protein
MNERKCCMAMPSWFIGSHDDVRVHFRVGPRRRFMDRSLALNLVFPSPLWPDSQTFVTNCLKGMTDDARRQIVWENATRLYNIADN